jgi:hypothetical protein
MEKVKKNFWDDFRFEFNLYINDNIICQRMFNVKGYNKQVLNSLELNELMRSLTGINNNELGYMGVIPTYFKYLCSNVSWRHYNPYRLSETSENVKPMFDSEDIFTFEIKVDKRVVAKSQFSGNWFQTDVRYAVNIRDIIPEIISEIEEYMSREEYTLPYESGVY